jgi:hypothetical protein
MRLERKVNKTCLFAAFALFVATTVARAGSEASPSANDGAGRPSRPNIVFLLTDD